MQRISIDLETMGSSPTSAIVQIGVYHLDNLVEASPQPDRSLLMNVDLEDSLRQGMTVDAATVYWWLHQSDVARASLLVPEPRRLRASLVYLNQWLTKRVGEEDIELWSHNSFDAPILHYAYKLLDIRTPWRYSRAMDLRTLKYVPGPEVSLKRGSEQEHVASWDAFAQGMEVVAKLGASA